MTLYHITEAGYTDVSKLTKEELCCLRGGRLLYVDESSLSNDYEVYLSDTQLENEDKVSILFDHIVENEG